jgi:hypothetical protein
MQAHAARCAANDLASVRSQADLIVTHAMLGKPTQGGLLSPYKIHPDGHLVPDSPYFAALWKLIRQASGTGR